MSESSDFRCPNCGAPLTAQGDAKTVQCSFCGTQAIVPLELRERPAVQPAANIPPTALPGFEEVVGRMNTASTSVDPVGRREAAKPRQRSSNLGCLLTLVLVAAGLSLYMRFASGSSGLSSLVGNLAGTPTPTVEPIERTLTSELPRTLRYGGFTFHITQGMIDNQSEQNNRVTYLAGQAFARLKVDMQNTTQEDLFLDAQLFKLKLADGNAYPMDTDIVLNSNFIAPQPGASSSTQFVFDVPASAEWDGATLIVGGKDSEPAEMPLTGAIPNDPYPMQIALPQETKTASQEFTYEILSEVFDVNSGSKPAAKGTHFLLLNLRMTNTDGKYGANLSSDNYRLTVDGITLAPTNAPIEVVDYQSSMDRQVVFMIPVTASQATLQVGNVRADPKALGSLQLDLTKTTPKAGS